ncbi:hypothetical protein M9Y10_045819 [Tritrichomonas musculus]|uniref:TLDc domain-containing protein n=1 Tax=Tritrichomonas musculus TaxID=1915356 RepID=A0ABR2JWM8_9EUKA
MSNEQKMKKYFTYLDKEYEFDYNLMKKCSLYFSEKQNELINNQRIDIFDNSLPKLSNDSIISFISFCQNQEYKITKENIIAIHSLSVKYQVEKLVAKTEKLIAKSHLVIIEYFISKFKDLKKFSVSKYEEILSIHLLDHISKDYMLKLPISNLYRVLNRFYTINQHLSIDQRHEMNVFLVKYYKHSGNDSSIILNYIDLMKEKTDFLNQLLNDFMFSIDNNDLEINQILMKFIFKVQHYKQLRIEKEICILRSKNFDIESRSNHLEEMQILLSQRYFSDFNNLNRKIDDLNEAKYNSNRKIDDLNEAFNNSNRKIDDLNEAFNNSNRKIDDLNEAFNNLNRKIDDHKKAINKKIYVLNKHVDDIENLDYNLIIPYSAKPWCKISSTRYYMNTSNKKFTVISSSTWKGQDDHAPYNLFNGLSERKSGRRWASNDSRKNSSYIIIGLSSPEKANVLIMMARDYWNSQAPTSFSILGGNSEGSFTKLKDYYHVNWSANEEKVFFFTNKNKYGYYKIEFYSSNHYTFGLSELNLGKFGQLDN